jgi:hypothetical protein
MPLAPRGHRSLRDLHASRKSQKLTALHPPYVRFSSLSRSPPHHNNQRVNTNLLFTPSNRQLPFSLLPFSIHYYLAYSLLESYAIFTSCTLRTLHKLHNPSQVDTVQEHSTSEVTTTILENNAQNCGSCRHAKSKISIIDQAAALHLQVRSRT